MYIVSAAAIRVTGLSAARSASSTVFSHHLRGDHGDHGSNAELDQDQIIQ
jgi:hypothetical protein